MIRVVISSRFALRSGVIKGDTQYTPASVWTYQIDEYPWWSWCQECHSVQWFYRDILLSWLFSFSHPLSKIEVFLFFETASLYLVYCLLIIYARCRFQKHKIFYFLKVETMDSKFHKKEQFPANIWLKKHILPSRGMFFL